MRIPSGLSSHGPELTSHYCKDNAEKRLSHSAQDTLKINQGSVTHYTALLISLFFGQNRFPLVLSLHKVLHASVQKSSNLKPSLSFHCNWPALIESQPCSFEVLNFHSPFSSDADAISAALMMTHCSIQDLSGHSAGAQLSSGPRRLLAAVRTKETKEPGWWVKADDMSWRLVLSLVPSTTVYSVNKQKGHTRWGDINKYSVLCVDVFPRPSLSSPLRTLERSYWSTGSLTAWPLRCVGVNTVVERCSFLLLQIISCNTVRQDSIKASGDGFTDSMDPRGHARMLFSIPTPTNESYQTVRYEKKKFHLPSGSSVIEMSF